MGGARWCISVLVVLVCTCGVVYSGRTSSVIASCTAVKPILEMKNLSLDIPDQPVNGKEMCHFLHRIKRFYLKITVKWGMSLVALSNALFTC